MLDRGALVNVAADPATGEYATYPFEAKEIAKSKELAEPFFAAFEECVTGAGDGGGKAGAGSTRMCKQMLTLLGVDVDYAYPGYAGDDPNLEATHPLTKSMKQLGAIFPIGSLRGLWS